MSLKKQFLKSNASCKITFRLTKKDSNGAENVKLVGSFTNWEKDAIEMSKLKSGDFTATVTLPANNQYEFRYLLDGTSWLNDSEADAFQANGLGEENSVLSTEC